MLKLNLNFANITLDKEPLSGKRQYILLRIQPKFRQEKRLLFYERGFAGNNFKRQTCR